MWLLIAAQLALALFTFCRALGRAPVAALVSCLATAGGAWTAWAAYMCAVGTGGGWGRPLRVRGRQVHPELRLGADWTLGAQPDPTGLDEPTRRALEALWLHDAQKEHASVPAFARVSWLLAAVGAPAELVSWSHRAALEEIEHARLCFALAAGYGGGSFTVEPMSDLLLAGLRVRGDAIELMVRESLGDGCQLEDFNADIAHACALGCEEPATRAVLEQVPREERSHADFSWALIEWLLRAHPERARPALAAALERLPRYARPTAVAADKLALVAAADAAQLRRHGRLPDSRWRRLWLQRLATTTVRVQQLLAAATTATPAAVAAAVAPVAARAAVPAAVPAPARPRTARTDPAMLLPQPPAANAPPAAAPRRRVTPTSSRR